MGFYSFFEITAGNTENQQMLGHTTRTSKVLALLGLKPAPDAG